MGIWYQKHCLRFFPNTKRLPIEKWKKKNAVHHEICCRIIFWVLRINKKFFFYLKHCTVTLEQYAMANFMMNSVFLFSIFTQEPFFIWEKPQKAFLGSNALFFNNKVYFLLLWYIPQLIICFSQKKKNTFQVKKWAFDPMYVFWSQTRIFCFGVKCPFFHL